MARPNPHGRDGGQPPRPAITVLSVQSCGIERQVLAGIEEEGVPYVIERPAAPASAQDLAVRASQQSSLGVGIGIDEAGRVCVQHEKLARPLPDLTYEGLADASQARAAGHNAARIVTGIPLCLGKA